MHRILNPRILNPGILSPRILCPKIVSLRMLSCRWMANNHLKVQNLSAAAKRPTTFVMSLWPGRIVACSAFAEKWEWVKDQRVKEVAKGKVISWRSSSVEKRFHGYWVFHHKRSLGESHVIRNNPLARLMSYVTTLAMILWVLFDLRRVLLETGSIFRCQSSSIPTNLSDWLTDCLMIIK